MLKNSNQASLPEINLLKLLLNKHPLFFLFLPFVFILFSCTTYKDVIKAQQVASEKSRTEQTAQMNLELQTRQEYITSVQTAWSSIENKNDLQIYNDFLNKYYFSNIYYFLYEPALIKIAETFIEDSDDLEDSASSNKNQIHFVHNYGLGLNPTVVLDTRKPEDVFIEGDIYVFDFLYINRKTGNSLLADTAYWAPTKIENRIGLNKTEIFLRNIPGDCKFDTHNWYVILKYVGDIRVFTVNGTDDVIEAFDVLWYNPIFNESK